MSLTPASGTITFATPFTTTITVGTDDGMGTITPSTTVPVVTASPVDPGVTITTSPGTVVLSGSYTSVIPVTWHWLDDNMLQKSGPAAPAVGTFKKITGVDSPTSLSATCTYTIDGESFVHTVSIPSFSTIADILKSLLASVK
jgi:hypothetical protein